MNARTMSVYTVSNHAESNSDLQSFELQCRKLTVPNSPALLAKLKKVIVKFHEEQEHNIRIYCISNTKIHIISLHWNKQHHESVIIQWGCRLLDENFHLVLMVTCFAMQICRSVERWAILLSTFWHYSPSKQTSARGGKAYSYNGFLNFFSTCSSAFWRLTSSSRSML